MSDDQDDYYDGPDDGLDEDDEDGLDDCRMGADGLCELAGTEWCDWCCPLGAAAQLRCRPRLTPPEGSS